MESKHKNDNMAVDGGLLKGQRWSARRKLAEAQRQIGEMTMENELLRERCRKGGGPFLPGRSQR